MLLVHSSNKLISLCQWISYRWISVCKLICCQWLQTGNKTRPNLFSICICNSILQSLVILWILSVRVSVSINWPWSHLCLIEVISEQLICIWTREWCLQMFLSNLCRQVKSFYQWTHILLGLAHSLMLVSCISTFVFPIWMLFRASWYLTDLLVVRESDRMLFTTWTI